jgi:hypothetical protein
LTAAQVRALDSSQSAAPPGAAVRVLALEDAFDPEQATDQATVRPRAPYTLGHRRVTAAERKRRQRNVLPHLKIFFKNVLRQKGYPL